MVSVSVFPTEFLQTMGGGGLVRIFTRGPPSENSPPTSVLDTKDFYFDNALITRTFVYVAVGT